MEGALQAEFDAVHKALDEKRKEAIAAGTALDEAELIKQLEELEAKVFVITVTKVT